MCWAPNGNQALTYASRPKESNPLRDLKRSNQTSKFSDSSWIGGHVGTAAVIYKNREEKSCVRLYMGTEDEHTVFDAELAGVAIGVKLLNQVTGKKYMIGLDNQAAIQTTRKEKFIPGQDIINALH